jgi:hypothetical protein
VIGAVGRPGECCEPLADVVRLGRYEVRASSAIRGKHDHDATVGIATRG